MWNMGSMYISVFFIVMLKFGVFLFICWEMLDIKFLCVSIIFLGRFVVLEEYGRYIILFGWIFIFGYLVLFVFSSIEMCK